MHTIRPYFGIAQLLSLLAFSACTATVQEVSPSAREDDTLALGTATASDARLIAHDGAYRESERTEAFVPLNAPEARAVFIGYQGPAAAFAVTHISLSGSRRISFVQPSEATLEVARETILSMGAGRLRVQATVRGEVVAELELPIRDGATECPVDCARGDFTCLVETRARCAASPFGDSSRRRAIFAAHDELGGMLEWLNETSSIRPRSVTRSQDEIVVEFGEPVPNLRALQQRDANAVRAENALQVRAAETGTRYSIRGFLSDDGLPIVLDTSTGGGRMDPTGLFFVDLLDTERSGGAAERGCNELGLDGTLHVDTSWTYSTEGGGDDSTGTRVEAPLVGVQIFLNSTMRLWGSWLPFVPWNGITARTDSTGHVRATMCRNFRNRDRLLDVKYLFHDGRALVGQQDPWTLASELIPGASTLYFDATGLDGTELPGAVVRNFGTRSLTTIGTTTGIGESSSADDRAAAVFYFATTLEKLWMDNDLGNDQRMMPIHALYPARVSIDYPSLLANGLSDPVFGKIHLRDGAGFRSLRWRTVAHEMTHIWEYDHGPNNALGFLASIVFHGSTHPCQTSPGVAFLEGLAESLVDEYYCEAFGVSDCNGQARARSRDQLSAGCAADGLLLTAETADNSDVGVEATIRAWTIPTPDVMRASLVTLSTLTTVDGNTYEARTGFGPAPLPNCNHFLGPAVRWQDVLRAYGRISTLGNIALQSNPLYFMRQELLAETGRSADWLAFRDTYALWDLPTPSPAAVCAASTPAPTCTDGLQNGTETGIDCGSPCAACLGASCNALGCVAGASCVNNLCVPTTTCSYNNMTYTPTTWIQQTCLTTDYRPGRKWCQCVGPDWTCSPCLL